MSEEAAATVDLTDNQRFKLLSDREVEICQFVVDGFSNSEIAKKLDLKPQTVKVHLRNAFKKLNINHRIELIRFLKPRKVAHSKQTEFDKGDEMILNLIAAGLTDQEVANAINQNATPDQMVAVTEVRVVVGRLRRWTGIETRTALAIWWLHHRGLIELAPKTQEGKALA